MLKEYIRPDDGLDKAGRKAEAKRLQDKLTAQQMLLRDAQIPVIVMIEGWSAAGKGTLISDLISEIDPRFSSVFLSGRARYEEDRYPFLYPFFSAIPENGKLLFMDSGWMESSVRAYCTGEIGKDDFRRRMRSVNRFERQLRDNGYLLLKLFIDIPRKEQKKRLDERRGSRDTAWRVSEYDLRQNREYSDFRKAYDCFMTGTQEFAPWHILDGSRKSLRNYDAFRLLTALIDEGLAAGKYHGAPVEEDFPLLEMPELRDVDLGVSIGREEYKKELDALQAKIAHLHNVIYRKRIPFVICYEGWDAAGKGGNIRRLAYPLIPAVSTCIPSPRRSPTKRHGIISGASGRASPAAATSPSSTAPGTAA